MLVVRVQGGLGNQIFQYLFALKLKRMFPDTEVAIDLNSYRRYHPHNGYELDKWFSLDPSVCPIPMRHYYSRTGFLPYVGSPRLMTKSSIPAVLVRKVCGAVNRCIDALNSRIRNDDRLIAQKYATHYPPPLIMLT